MSSLNPLEPGSERTLTPEDVKFADTLVYNDQGLIPAIVQDYLDGTVLMMAWMNHASILKTLATGRTWFWSRSRQSLWPKGDTSGHIQYVKDLRADCDQDTLLITVEQVGDVACHTGSRSCFFQSFFDPASETEAVAHKCDFNHHSQRPMADTLSQVYGVIRQRQANPTPDSYTCKLLSKGDNTILKKLGEETAEVVMAVKDQDPDAIAGEVADLWYHCLVALAHHHVDIKDVYRKLQSRRGPK